MDAPTSIFTRRLIEGGLKIESTCNYCGTVLVASFSEGIAQKEDEHIDKCQRLKIAD